MLPSNFFFAISQVQQYREPGIPSTSMHCPYLAETLTTLLLVFQASVTAFMLSYVPPSRLELMEWSLLPMLGATIAAGIGFCLNPQIEVRKIVMGRCLGALILGVVGPRFVATMQPWVLELLSDPFLKVGAGAIGGYLGYIIVCALTKKAFDRATPIAEQLIKAGEARLVANISSQVAANVAQVASGVATELATNPHPESPAHTAEVIANVSKQNAESTESKTQ